MYKPHKHAELIKAWADGAVVQRADSISGEWKDVSSPSWSNDAVYRIKPKPVLCRLYKRSNMTGLGVCENFEQMRIKALNGDPTVTWVTPWFNPEDIKEST